MPGSSRSSTGRVPSGVRSRGPTPVPPDVITSRAPVVDGRAQGRLDRGCAVRHDHRPGPPANPPACSRPAASGPGPVGALTGRGPVRHDDDDRVARSGARGSRRQPRRAQPCTSWAAVLMNAGRDALSRAAGCAYRCSGAGAARAARRCRRAGHLQGRGCAMSNWGDPNRPTGPTVPQPYEPASSPRATAAYGADPQAPTGRPARRAATGPPQPYGQALPGRRTARDRRPRVPRRRSSTRCTGRRTARPSSIRWVIGHRPAGVRLPAHRRRRSGRGVAFGGVLDRGRRLGVRRRRARLASADRPAPPRGRRGPARRRPWSRSGARAACTVRSPRPAVDADEGAQERGDVAVDGPVRRRAVELWTGRGSTAAVLVAVPWAAVVAVDESRGSITNDGTRPALMLVTSIGQRLLLVPRRRSDGGRVVGVPELRALVARLEELRVRALGR